MPCVMKGNPFMYKLLELPRQQDIVALRRALWAHRIGHQVTEEEAVQVVLEQMTQHLIQVVRQLQHKLILLQ